MRTAKELQEEYYKRLKESFTVEENQELQGISDMIGRRHTERPDSRTLGIHINSSKVLQYIRYLGYNIERVVSNKINIFISW